MIRRALTWIKWLLVSVLALLVLVLGLVSLTVSTEFGSRWVLGQVAQRLPVEFVGVQGDLINGLDISVVEYAPESTGDTPPQRHRVEGLAFRWQPFSLLYSTVSVQSLRADSVLLRLPPGEEDPSDEPNQAITDWPSLALPVRIELGKIQLNDIRVEQGETTTEIRELSGSLTLGTFNLRLDRLNVVADDYGLGATGYLGLRHPYPADLQLDWYYQLPNPNDPSPDANGEPLMLSGSGHLTGDVDIVTLEHELAEPLAMQTSLRLQPALGEPEKTPRLIMDSEWRRQMPPAAVWTQDQPRPVTSGQISLDGWLDLYQLSLDADVSAEGYPDATLKLNGEGSLEQFVFEQLQLRTPQGRAEAEGQLAWAPHLSWDLAVSAEEFDPSVYVPDWPGEITAQFDTRGSLESEQLMAQLRDLQLSGQLRGLALSGSGAARYQGDRVEADQLTLSLGANQMTVNGSALVGAKIGEEMALNWTLEAPVLSQLDPGLGGRLSASGELVGSLSEPQLKISAQGEELSWQDAYELEKFTLELQQPVATQYQLSLHAQGLELAGQTVQYAGLTGSGSRAEHDLQMRVVSGAHGRLDWALAGGYVDQRWEGELAQLELAPVALSPWHLKRPAPLVLAPDELRLEGLCLVPDEDDTVRPGGSRPRPTPDQAAQLCALANWQPDTGLNAEGDIDGLPLLLLSRWLTPQMALGGFLEGQFLYRQPAQGTASGGLHLEAREAEIRYRHGEGDVEVYPWPVAELDATLEQEQLDATLVMDWGDYGRARAELGLAIATGELVGSLQATSPNLAPVEAFAPQLQEVAGNLSINFDLGGSVSDPRLRGRADLTEATAKVPEFGLHLQNIELHADSDVEQISLSGRAESGAGSLTIDGQWDRPGKEDWQIQANLSGDRFLVANTSRLKAQLTPDLNLNASAQETRLEGGASIPKALVSIQNLPETATQASSDVVIKTPEGEAQQEEGAPLFVDLYLVLGDDVRFEGMGLEARLSGAMGLLKTPERDWLTTGEVGVAEGTYTAYGQDLIIERGRLIFQGPYDNPGLDIRAVRVVDDITAGLQIGGTLKRPRSEVFSNPTMSDSDAMAVLFTGKPLSAGSSSADASMLVNAIGGMGLERSGFITAEIAETFGLDEFTIQTEDDVTESALRIGKYLTPKLFVRYVVGLFNQTTTIGLRYDLTQSLRLEAESGITQSVDMIYNIER